MTQVLHCPLVVLLLSEGLICLFLFFNKLNSVNDSGVESGILF